MTYRGRAGVIEVDGPHHASPHRRASDLSREKRLRSAGIAPAGWSGRAVDAGLVPRPGPASAHGHHPIPEGSVTMFRRPSEAVCGKTARTV